MEGSWILPALKFLGLTVGLASTIWGMTRRVTTEDNGEKKLTAHGQVAVALALGGYLVAAVSQGLEVLVNQAKARDARIEEVAAAARDAAREARELRIERRQQQTLNHLYLTRLEQGRLAAEGRAALAESRLFALRTATEQRLRAFALARSVDRGTRRNLERTGQALGQIERVLFPLPQICMQVNWRPVVPQAELERATARLAVLASERRLNPSLYPPGVSGSAAFSVIEPDSAYYPDDDRPGETALGYVLSNPTSTVMFLAAGRSLNELFEGAVFDQSLDDGLADLSLDLGYRHSASREAELRALGGERNLAHAPPIYFDAATREISFDLNYVHPYLASPTGQIVSLPDLERARIALVYGLGMGDSSEIYPMRPRISWLRAGMRVYHPIGGAGEITLTPQTIAGRTLWTAERIPLGPDTGITPLCPTGPSGEAAAGGAP